MHIYISKINKWKRKRNIPDPSKPERKDASLDQPKDGYHLCYHQPFKCRTLPGLDKAEILANNYCTLKLLGLMPLNPIV